ncbi:MAG: DUF4867 family protein [Lachnospiraceae bacterium]|nr:DUF4867 family protein [Lachnospiraceae bacterium]
MSDLLDRLNEVNDVEIKSVFDESFNEFGVVHSGYDLSELITYMENETEIPAEGNVYVPSVEAMELTHVAATIKSVIYGGMPIQIGYCNGRNSTYNGFEYHKCSELNIAVNDMMLVLGNRYDIKNCHYNNDDAKVFFVPKGTMIEMYDTTLHLSPLKVCDEGFRAVVVLAEGTNTPLATKEKKQRDDILTNLANRNMEDQDTEVELLLARNKWVVAHPDRKPLIDQGAYPGIIGENKELFY